MSHCVREPEPVSLVLPSLDRGTGMIAREACFADILYEATIEAGLLRQQGIPSYFQSVIFKLALVEDLGTRLAQESEALVNRILLTNSF